MNRKTSVVGGCLLVLFLGAYAFFHFGLLCLFVPCDRPLILKIRISRVVDPQAAHCALQLFGKGKRKPFRSADIEGDAAEFITGAWGRRYDGRVVCRGFKPSPPIPIDDSGDKETIDLGTVRLEPDASRN
jgi:hypothetical protein